MERWYSSEHFSEAGQKGIPWGFRVSSLCVAGSPSTPSTSLCPGTFSETFVSTGFFLWWLHGQVCEIQSEPTEGEWQQPPFHSFPFSWFVYSCDYCHLIVQLHPPTTIHVATISKRGKEQAVLSSVCSGTIISSWPPLETMAEAWDVLLSWPGTVFRWENIFKFRRHPPFTFKKTIK